MNRMAAGLCPADVTAVIDTREQNQLDSAVRMGRMASESTSINTTW